MAVFNRLLRSSPPPPHSTTALLTTLIRQFTTVHSETTLITPPQLLQTQLPKVGATNVHWVFLGCPGVGKGTYATRLSKLLGVPHIATGDLVRLELSSSGPLSPELAFGADSLVVYNWTPVNIIVNLAEIVNQGKLVPDEIIIHLLSKRLEVGETMGESGFILDGFPRTLRQAEILEGVIDIDLVVNLKLREEALIAKCLGRRICSECGRNYNVACIDIKGDNETPGLYMAPLPPPPQCASKLITRADDKEEVVKERLRIYNEMVLSVTYYKEHKFGTMNKEANQNIRLAYSKYPISK